MTALAFDHLSLGYARRAAVRDITGSVAVGSLLAVVGPNGAGKSTLLKGIAGALAPLAGTLRRASGLDVAYLPQAAELDRSFPISARELAAMGLWRSSGAFGRIGPRERGAVANALAAVGLAGLAERPIGTLSGGQLQRTLFARLLIQDAALILLDEPFTAIDRRTAADLLALIRGWHHEGRTVIAVFHDVDLVRRAFPLTLLLAGEVVAWGPTAQVLSEANLARARRLSDGAADGSPAAAAR